MKDMWIEKVNLSHRLSRTFLCVSGILLRYRPCITYDLKLGQSSFLLFGDIVQVFSLMTSVRIIVIFSHHCVLEIPIDQILFLVNQSLGIKVRISNS